MNTLLLPANLLSLDDDTEYLAIEGQILDKQSAGFDVTLVDVYGRLLSYQLLDGPSGGVNTYMSSLAGLDNFTNFNVPFPIITSVGAQLQCGPPSNATQYEFTPYEFGSWDMGVSAFTPVKNLGSELNNGKPTQDNTCVKQYDNLGYVLGTSSDVFSELCEVVEPVNNTSADLQNNMEAMVNLAHQPVFSDLFAIYPNPFYNYSGSSVVADAKDLTLVDGGFSGQNNPIWPFIQEARDVDVLIVNDNSADTNDNFPNGTEIRLTYERAKAVGLAKMPFIPTADTFASENLTNRAQFFGCNETGTVLIIWLPNADYTFDSGQPTLRLEYPVNDTNAMIENGVQIAIQGGDDGWPFCLACAIKNADANALPDGCNACFEKYCYTQAASTD